MNNINDILTELDLMLEQESDKNSKAEEAMRKAEELKARAAIQQKEAVEKQKRIEEARRRVEEARSVLNEINHDDYDRNTTTRNTENKDNTVVYTKNVNNTTKTKKSGIGVGFVSGALVASLLIGGFALCKDGKNGKLSASLSGLFGNKKNEQTVDGNGRETYFTEYTYNYGENVVTAKPVPTEKPVFSYQEDVVTNDDKDNYDYITLTTERFEDLVTSVINKFNKLNLNFKKEDVIKFVTIFNIDKLKQDNPELVKSIMGTQTIEEVFADGEKVSDTLLNHEAEVMFANDNPEWQAYMATGLQGQYVPNTDLIVTVSDCVFDQEQQELIKSFEDRRNEILKVSDAETRSEMVSRLLLDILNSQSEYRDFDDASLELVLRHCIVTLDGYYCRDFLSNRLSLNDKAKELITQFIAPVGSTEEQIRNSIMSGARRNMMDSFKICVDDVKTLTK